MKNRIVRLEEGSWIPEVLFANIKIKVPNIK